MGKKFRVFSGCLDLDGNESCFLHLAVPEVQEVFETLTETGDDYDTPLAKLHAYFKP